MHLQLPRAGVSASALQEEQLHWALKVPRLLLQLLLELPAGVAKLR